MKKLINDIKAYLIKNADTLSNESLAALVALYSWLEPFVKDAKEKLSVEYGTGKNTCGAYTVTITEIKTSTTVKSMKELETIGITPNNNPQLFKEKNGYVRVSVK